MLALSIKELTKEYVAGKRVLDGISLDFPAETSAITAIIGPSGTGKSTLIRCVNRLVEPTGGRVVLHGADITHVSGLALRHARRQIGMVFQEYNLVERLTVMENLLTGRLGFVAPWRAFLRKFPPDDIARAFALLDTVGLGGFAHRRADALSGGQRQRVGIARAVMQQPKLILADEPTSSLDPRTSVEIMELLGQIAAQTQTPVIINMHDVALAKRFAGRLIGMAGGKVVYDGDAAGLDDAILTRIYGGQSWLH